MEFRTAKPEDFEFIKKHALYPEAPDKRELLADDDFVCEHGDYIMAMGGFRRITDATAWGYIALTEYVGAHLIPTYRIISEYLEIWCKENHIVRLQAWVASDFVEGHRTIRHLGFSEERPMPHFCGKDKHATLYVRFFDGEQ